MKILLVGVNAKYIHTGLAIRSLKKYSGFKEVELCEYTINHEKGFVISEIFKKKADVLAFSCYIWNINYIYEICSDLSKILPETDIWLGGPEVSFDAEEVLKNHPYLKGVMRGEGEEIFKELSSFYVKKETDLESIKGITYKEKDEIIKNPDMPLLNMDLLPFCYDEEEFNDKKIMYYEGSRGCPFSCSYCLSSLDKKVRFKSIDLVKKELKIFIEKKVPQVKFVDRTFNCSKKYTMAVWKFLVENDKGITNFHFEIEADILDDEEIELINSMRPGLIQLEIGVQSTNDNTIKAINRRVEFSKIKKAVEKIAKNNNVHQHLDLIAGLPFEGFESFRKSYNDVYSLKPNQLQLGFLKVLKGSKMHEMAKEYGIKYQNKAPYEVLMTDFLSYDEIIKIKLVEEMTEVYYNSHQFDTCLATINPQNTFDFFLNLGKYYDDKGLLEIKHKRVSRYEILIDYVKNEALAEEKLLLEAADFDLYLRENMKTRPAFSKSYSNEEKEIIKEFYKKEAMEHNLLKDYEKMDYKQLMRMTHIGIYSNDFTRADADFKLDNEKKYYILFDYKNRSEIDYSARVYLINDLLKGETNVI
ncbi:Radical SAM superfamily enzyme YgiQ, UPF0313 family [Acetitomaculum ruminis DSM 5522]|uniref:Radical SAM superfamily enzyme YgiQ, UPF0313 family n=1 Tax=Acetitomaculum ruminis DSM 5522 TaxID=1120918 RepID=A0A1I0XD57_9FIRM|nr:B12-binding domain-containing radical SAM protein [Acetitomaculum ruminis]SFA98962.1 Radical SAM superfamily enzyme YgiQ, UPF0313 family [Acetitomaculum ruminis DSM 5522]